MAEEHVGSKSLILFCLFSLPEDPPCTVGLGTEEGEGILAPDAAEKTMVWEGRKP